MHRKHFEFEHNTWEPESIAVISFLSIGCRGLKVLLAQLPLLNLLLTQSIGGGEQVVDNGDLLFASHCHVLLLCLEGHLHLQMLGLLLIATLQTEALLPFWAFEACMLHILISEYFEIIVALEVFDLPYLLCLLAFS